MQCLQSKKSLNFENCVKKCINLFLSGKREIKEDIVMF